MTARGRPFGFTLLLIVLLPACKPPHGKKKDGSAATPSSTLIDIDAAAAAARVFPFSALPNNLTVATILPEDLSMEINANTWFRPLHDPLDEKVAEEAEAQAAPCRKWPKPDDRLDSWMEGRLLVRLTSDLRPCAASPGPDETVNTLEAHEEWLVLLDCHGDDERYHQTTFRDLNQRVLFICKGEQFSALLQFHTRDSYESIQGTARLKATFHTWVNFSDRDGRPCQFTRAGRAWHMGDCQFTYAFKQLENAVTNDDRPSKEPVDWLTRLEFKDVAYGPDDRYFAKGAVHFEINHWQGSMTAVNGATPPRWQASNAGESRTGTYYGEKARTSAPIRTE